MSIETAGTARPGRLITVVGIDGAGKSTLAASLHATLKDSRKKVILVGKHTTEVPMSADLSEYVDGLNALVYRRKASVGPACGDHYWRLIHSLMRRSSSGEPDGSTGGRFTISSRSANGACRA